MYNMKKIFKCFIALFVIATYSPSAYAVVGNLSNCTSSSDCLGGYKCVNNKCVSDTGGGPNIEPVEQQCTPGTPLSCSCPSTTDAKGRVCGQKCFCDSFGMSETCVIDSNSCACPNSKPKTDSDGNCVECTHSDDCSSMTTSINIDGGKRYTAGWCNSSNACEQLTADVVCNNGYYRVDANRPLDRKCLHCSTGLTQSNGKYLANGIYVGFDAFYSKKSSGTTSGERSREYGYDGQGDCYVSGQYKDDTGYYNVGCEYK